MSDTMSKYLKRMARQSGANAHLLSKRKKLYENLATADGKELSSRKPSHNSGVEGGECPPPTASVVDNQGAGKKRKQRQKKSGLHGDSTPSDGATEGRSIQDSLLGSVRGHSTPDSELDSRSSGDQRELLS